MPDFNMAQATWASEPARCPGMAMALGTQAHMSAGQWGGGGANAFNEPDVVEGSMLMR